MRLKPILIYRKSSWVVAAVALAACGGSPPVRVDPNFVADSVSRARGDSQSHPRSGVLVMAHGGSAEWNQAVRAAVQPLAERLPTSIALGMADRETLERAVRDLEHRGVDRIAVVRLFVSGTSFLETTAYLLGQRDPPPSEGGRGRRSESERRRPPIQTSSEIAIDPDGLAQGEEAGRILVARARSLSRDPTSEVLLILGHGMADAGRNARLLDRMDHHADAVRQALPLREVRVETLREDWPEDRARAKARIREWVKAHSDRGHRVLVVPYRVFGFGPYGEVLEDLDYAAEGLGLLPHPAISEWLLTRTRTVLASQDWEMP